MKCLLTCCIVALNLIVTSTTFADDEYAIRISPAHIRANWRGPENDRVLPSWEQGYDQNGKPVGSIVIPVDLKTKEGRAHSLEALEIVMASRDREFRAAVDGVGISVDAWSRSNSDHRKKVYRHNHTTGSVDHNHNHSGTVNTNVNVQATQPCGSYHCGCGVRRQVYRYGSHYRYWCPRNNRYFYSYNRSWNWGHFRGF